MNDWLSQVTTTCLPAFLHSSGSRKKQKERNWRENWERRCRQIRYGSWKYNIDDSGSRWWSVQYCIVLYCAIGVTIEEEAGMTVCSQCWGQSGVEWGWGWLLYPCSSLIVVLAHCAMRTGWWCSDMPLMLLTLLHGWQMKIVKIPFQLGLNVSCSMMGIAKPVATTDTDLNLLFYPVLCRNYGHG